MYRLRVISLLVLLLSAHVSSCQSVRSLESKIDAYLLPYLDMNAWSGVISIAKDGDPVFQKAYGYANREWMVKNTVDSKFRIASISKVFTEVAILKLAEQGNLSLERKLVDYIPDYPRGEDITIRHLMEHRSGIPHLNSFPNYSDLIKNAYDLNQIIQLFKYKPLDFDPGLRYSYSNSGYVLLAYIIEKVSGLSFEEYLNSEIFQKMDLQSTGIDRNEEILDKRVSGYMFDNIGSLVNAEYVNMSIKVGGGSLYSTAGDLVRFVDQLLRKTVISSTLSELPNFSSDVDSGLFTANGRVQGFCHQITHRIEEGLTIIVLGNHYSNIALPISDDIYKIYSGESYSMPVNYFEDEVVISTEDLRKYEGVYDFGFGPVGKVKVIGEYLTYLPPGREVPDRLISLGNNRFFYPQSWVLLEFRDLNNENFGTLDWIMGENTYSANRISN